MSALIVPHRGVATGAASASTKPGTLSRLTDEAAAVRSSARGP